MSRLGIRQVGNQQAMSQALWQSPFMCACRGEPTGRLPVWLMRQAGRYMQHYRERRAGRSFLELCRDSELAAEVTVYAQEWLDTDAAIIFADILLILAGLGMELGFDAGHGPRLQPPLRSLADLDRLGDGGQAAADCGYVAESVRLTRSSLAADIPLIGFCGAPFTLSAYAIEGGSSRQFAATRSFMYQHSAAWHRLQEKLVSALVPYLSAQVAAGAQALQLFDSWVGIVTRADFQEFVQPHLRQLIQSLPAGIPIILFGTDCTHLLDCQAACGPDVIGLDQRCDPAAAWARLGGPEQISIQGSLDPGLLLAPRERLDQACAAMINALRNENGEIPPGWIANLGHGVLKETDPEQARHLVSVLHEA